jgi:hypothetical protein
MSPETPSLLARTDEARDAFGARLAERQWTEAEAEVVRTLRLKDAAKVLTGRTVASIRSRRHTLGVPDGRRRNG